MDTFGGKSSIGHLKAIYVNGDHHFTNKDGP